jgi:hypothetical protein
VIAIGALLSAITIRSNPHSFNISIRPNSPADVWVITEEIVVPVGQVIIGKLRVPRNDVTAIVQLIIGVTKQHTIACIGQKGTSYLSA